MKRLSIPALALAIAGCVSVQDLPNPHGALKPEHRLVVDVYPAPGPWIINSADSKAETAAKISPIGMFVQTAEDEHTLSVSQNLEQYLPRPPLGLMVQDSLLEALRKARSAQTVRTGLEAGLSAGQLATWNKSKDQLDWRRHYYSPYPDSPAPRDYSRVLTLDDAMILDVNVSFGTSPTEDGRILPTMTAASRVYRGDTSSLVWEHEDIVSDRVSSATLTDYATQPAMLTDSLQKIAPGLGAAIAASFLKAFDIRPSTATLSYAASSSSAPAAAGTGGLVPISVFQNMPATAPAVSVSTSP